MAGDHKQDPDVQLMLKAGAGDLQSFESLVVKHQKSVLNAAYRYTGNPSVAEELAQDVFVRVFRAAPTYKPEARFSTWLFTIVRNVCSNYRMRQGKHDHQMDAESDLYALSQNDENPEEAAIRNELESKIQKAVLALPESLRMPLILSQFQQMSYEEIANVLELSVAAV
ncbi:MAG TPA: sigma-70 family RNA polymerase sigma factor, partial [Acidobacteriota bacterium]|nr:sigma-70 family RNA polymerase sigma factor [Acidobacteriota bacterium]